MSDSVNLFDNIIISAVNSIAKSSWSFDFIVNMLSSNHLFKGAVLVSFLLWAWFRDSDNQDVYRKHVILTIMAGLIGTLIARVMALLLPFRHRPVHNDSLDFTLPYDVSTAVLSGHSSFPSDHAVLFYCLAIGMFWISKKAAWLAIFYVSIIIVLPRIYVGLHYPTDLVAGLLIGGAICCLLNFFFTENKYLTKLIEFSKRHAGVFYGFFFIAIYQIADLFESSREFARFFIILIGHHT